MTEPSATLPVPGVDQRVRPEHDPARITHDVPFTFLFDGQPVRAYPGETVGAALLAGGHLRLRSTRFGGRPRGLFCGIGVCYDCVVAVDGRANRRACLMPAKPGMSVFGAWLPDRERVATAIAGPGPAHPALGQLMEVELAIVGAGPAGLAAAAAAADAGCRVVLIDAYARPGGQYFRQTPREFDAQVPEALHHDFGVARRLFARLDAAPGVEIVSGGSVWAAEPLDDGATLYIGATSGSRALRARAVVLASGAHDRVLPFPGWDLPGVLTVGGAQALVKGQRVLPGRRVLLSGSGPFLLPVAAGLAEAGARVVGVCEATTPRHWAHYIPRAWGHLDKLAEGAAYMRELRRHRVPLRFGQAAIRAQGEGHVESVTVARLAPDWTPIPGSEERLVVDVLAIGYGFVPAVELAVSLGCALRYDALQGGHVVRHDGEMRSSRDGVFVAGEITGIGGAAVALPQGALAGLAAARYLGRLSAGEAPARMALQRAALRRAQHFADTLNHVFVSRPGWLNWTTPDTVVCRCEEVTRSRIEAAVANFGARDMKAIKAVTRCGMGLCQGRICGPAVAALTAHYGGRDAGALGSFSGRTIVSPLMLGDLLDG
jgi:NADPH-dependent 2,4-dienoyl-CoA reductase/sulfur reductase-like enzyme